MRKKILFFILLIPCFLFAACSNPHTIYIEDDAITDYVDIEVWYDDFKDTSSGSIPWPLWTGRIFVTATPTALAATHEDFSGHITIKTTLPDHFTFVSYPHDDFETRYTYDENTNQLSITFSILNSFDMCYGIYTIEADFFASKDINPNRLPSYGEFSIIPTESVLLYTGY